jgi:hypothetical protein
MHVIENQIRLSIPTRKKNPLVQDTLNLLVAFIVVVIVGQPLGNHKLRIRQAVKSSGWQSLENCQLVVIEQSSGLRQSPGSRQATIIWPSKSSHRTMKFLILCIPFYHQLIAN